MSRRTTRLIAHPRRGARLLLAAAAALSLAACAQTTVIPEPLPPDGVNKVQDRISDQAIAADRAYIQSLRARLKKLNDAGRPLDDYSLCKAGAWIDFAFSEYTDNDRGGIVEQALLQARSLIETMEAGGGRDYSETPVLADSLRLREDLWRFVAETKAANPIAADGKPGCAACALAKLEVQLIWIGNEYKDLGWRHADSAIRAAERYRNEVDAAVARCALPPTPPPAPPVEAAHDCPPLRCPTVTEPKAPLAPEPVAHNAVKVPILVHFAFGKTAIAPESMSILATIAQVLQAHPQTTLSLVGHADTRGNAKQNARLASDRADAVRAHLIALGITAERLSAHGAGALHVPTDAGLSQREAYARARRVDFVFDHLPDLETEQQLRDLQADR
jgi:outer membrane protein OmpA-like peptidoglycan-associated protein